jgi:hypothetical protein
MAPEQACGLALDRLSELFSLGSLLYEMAAGRLAFGGDSTLEVIRRVCDEEPAPLRALNPHAPPWLAEIVERLLEKDPAGRFRSAGEVAELLWRHLARLQDPSLPPVDHPWVRRTARDRRLRTAASALRAAWRWAAGPLLVAAGALAATGWSYWAPARVPERRTREAKPVLSRLRRQQEPGRLPSNVRRGLLLEQCGQGGRHPRRRRRPPGPGTNRFHGSKAGPIGSPVLSNGAGNQSARDSRSLAWRHRLPGLAIETAIGDVGRMTATLDAGRTAY